MQPFPAYKRRLYLALFVILFLILLPAVILYADGWRFKPGFGLVKTGGVYVAVPYPDATVFLNGEAVGRTGFLQRGFYIGDLAPSAYVVRAEKEGYRSWGRILVVEPQLVTDARALLIPEEIVLTRLATSTTATTSATTTPPTKIISSATYNAYVTEFATSTAASSTVPLAASSNIGLFLDDGQLFARWMRESAIPPSIFCSSPSYCALEVPIAESGGDVLDARFFADGVVYRTEEGGIYFVEIDVRPTPVSVQLFSASDADMRLFNNTLVIRSGGLLYEVEGL